MDRAPYVKYIVPVLALGVALEGFLGVPMPWRGLEYTVGDVEREFSRQSWTYGIERVSGFSMSYAGVGGDAVVFGLGALLCASRWVWRLVIVALTAMCIWLSTAKIALVAFALGIVVLVLSRAGWVKAAVGVTVATTAMVIALPLIVGDGGIGGGNDVVAGFLSLETLNERVQFTWPRAWALLSDEGGVSYVLGLGIGSIGGALQFSKLVWPNPADNLFIYLYVIGGLAGLGLLLAAVRGATRPGDWQSAALVLGVSLFSWGLTSSALENPVKGLLFGALLARGCTTDRSHDEAAHERAST